MTVACATRLPRQCPSWRSFPPGFVEAVRQVKDARRSLPSAQAIGYAQKAFEVVRGELRPEKTEKQVADELETADADCSGPRGAVFPRSWPSGLGRPCRTPGPPSSRSVGAISCWSIGAPTGGLYKSDLTRVLVTGRISPKLKRVYRVVLKAQEQAIAAIRPGVGARGRRPRGPRRHCARPVSDKYFGHGLGHGLGLAVHEAPATGRQLRGRAEAGNGGDGRARDLPSRVGAVFASRTTCLVTRTGHEVLTSVPKQLEEDVVSLRPAKIASWELRWPMQCDSRNQDFFDVRKIRRLVEMMNEHDLTEIDLRQGDTRIQLRRGGEPVVTAAAPASPGCAAPLPAPPAVAPRRPRPAPPPAAGGAYRR